MTKPLPLTEWQKSLPDTLPRHVRRRITPGPGGCWIMTGHTRQGYQRVSIGNRGVVAHRYVYETLRGPIPDGLTLDHLADRCSSKSCVQPDHLEPVTRGENALRGNGPAAINRRRELCKSGHSLTGSNVYIRPDNGNRQCRICQRRNQRRYAGRGMP